MMDGVCKQEKMRKFLKCQKIYKRNSFFRLKELVTDNAKGIDIVLYILDWLKENNQQKQYDLAILLQPKAPLRATNAINKAKELLFLKEAKSNCFSM